MENLKIRVNSKAESKEVQELFFELGYKKNAKFTKEDFIGFDGWICALDDGSCDYCPTSHTDKEITLPELRDMVVLRRNDPKDATHYRSDGKEYFQTSDKERHYHFQDDAWVLSTWMNYQLLPQLKPIEKKEMKAKEYLNKETYAYAKTHDLVSKDSNWIEIPEWAVAYADHKNGHGFFYDSFCKIASFYNIAWSRHTLPEELPFIDDECYTNKSDGGFRLPKVEPCDMSKWIEIRGDSLNDQYAEIETVRQSHRTASETSNPTIKETLNQRQSQYGSFEDVAMITEQMVDVMRKGYYENLAYNQKMALYMICSKIARIVNGNPNHKDSWHDIAGYATLIDNELVSEKDMPF